MAASGPPSQRKISVSTLVYSTLGPSLALLPSEEKVEVPYLTTVEGKSEEEAAASKDKIDSPLRISRMSAPGEIRCEAEEDQKANKLSTNGDLGRLYSSPASSFGRQGRLGFKTKTGAGSMSSMEQAEASMPKQFSLSMDEGSEAPSSPVSKQLQSQISPRTSEVGEPMSPR